MSAQRTLELLQRRGTLSSPEISAELALSQPTISRALTELGARIYRVGRGRATRYGATREIGPHGARWPFFRLDATGKAHELGELVALTHDRVVVESGLELYRQGATRDGWFDGLPWFLDDARPQGFLGRIIARRLGPMIGAPTDPLLWNNDHVLASLLSAGDDLPGDLVIGEPMLERALMQQGDAVVALARRSQEYLARADAALLDDVAGPSAGGEQPKFTARVEGERGSVRHVIVKFTNRGDGPARRRWHDLLVAEHLAGECLREAGHAAARSAIVTGERTFLEVERFDRSGASGRVGCVTLAALDSALHGARDDWRRAADRLERDGWIDPASAHALRVLHWVGRLIANTDMHFHNASFVRGESRPLAIAPVYDMLPMMYRPAATGEIVDRDFVPARAVPREAAIREEAARIAARIWSRVTNDVRVGDEFRAIAARNGELVLDA